ncbi:MAG: MYXO-CTERM sorting domain-containing protein [Myxococcota bacterium]
MDTSGNDGGCSTSRGPTPARGAILFFVAAAALLRRRR